MKTIMKLEIILFVLVGATTYSICSRVLELGDKFIELSRQGEWLVKFYAPWCAHCRRIEPVWAHVAQTLHNTNIKVAKIDCTRFTSVASHFKVRGYPTIMFIKGDLQHEYQGERTRDDLIEYAQRMSRPPIQHLTIQDSINYLKETNQVFFGYVGQQKGPLWEMYRYHAVIYQPHTSFYVMTHNIAKRDLNLPNRTNSLFVYKDDEPHYFDCPEHTMEDPDQLNRTLNKWINSERFGTFPKVTRSNINQLMDTEKYLVLAIVEENKINEISESELAFKNMVESVIRKRKKELHPIFQFGWVGSPELANSIAMSTLTVPHLLVLNSTTTHHHLPEDEPTKMTAQALSIFLDQIANQSAPVYGGNSILTRLRRVGYTVKSTIVEMWQGNPVLTALVFGLPFGFFSLICYSIFCADILDAPEEEDLEDDHEKKD